MRRYADLLLRLSLAFAFLYPPISAWFDPLSWVGYIPAFAYIFWPWSHFVFLHLFGVVEIILALWVLSGWKIVLPAAVMGLLILVIVVTNLSEMEVVFRDLSIAGLAFALTIRHWPQRVVSVQ